MARKPNLIEGEIAPPPPLPEGFAFDIAQARISPKWVRATAILLCGKERREARLESAAAEIIFDELPIKQSPQPKI